MRLFWIPIAGILLVNSINAQKSLETSFGDCITPDNQKGQCIHLKQCIPLSRILTKTQLVETERDFLKKSQCGSNDGNVLVCCAATKEMNGTNPDIKTLSLTPFPKGFCGRSVPDKLIGGSRALIDQYPWVALLSYERSDGRKGFNCGGVLISNRHVLTTAHCAQGPGSPTAWKLTGVRLGESNTATEKDCAYEEYCNDPPVDIEIEGIITHENYQQPSRNRNHDIALLKLSKEVQFTDWVSPICLPIAQNYESDNDEGLHLTLSGFSRQPVENQANVKLRTEISGIDIQTCKQKYEKYTTLHQEGQMCAKNDDVSCTIISGSPLMALNTSVPHESYHYVAGLVAFGTSECDAEGMPSVYTRVGTYIDWINLKMRS